MKCSTYYTMTFILWNYSIYHTMPFFNTPDYFFLHNDFFIFHIFDLLYSLFFPLLVVLWLLFPLLLLYYASLILYLLSLQTRWNRTAAGIPDSLQPHRQKQKRRAFRANYLPPNSSELRASYQRTISLRGKQTFRPLWKLLDGCHLQPWAAWWQRAPQRTSLQHQSGGYRSTLDCFCTHLLTVFV